jgi:importin subunit alpha-1
LQNLVADCKKIRDTLVKSQLYSKILDLMNPNIVYTPIAHNIVSLITNIHKLEGSENLSNYLVEKSTEILCSVAKANNSDLQLETMWGLANITNSPNPNVPNLIAQSGALENVVTFMKSNMDKRPVKLAFLKIIGNLTSNKDSFIDYIISLGVLGIILHFLNDSEWSIRRETLWMFSNIAAGRKEHIQILISEGYYDNFKLKIKDNELLVKLEAVWCVTNSVACSDLATKMELVRNHSLLETLKECLQINNLKIVLMALEALREIFIEYSKIVLDKNDNKLVEEFLKIGGGDVLERLQDSEHETVLRVVYNLITEFFPAEIV